MRPRIPPLPCLPAVLLLLGTALLPACGDLGLTTGRLVGAMPPPTTLTAGAFTLEWSGGETSRSTLSIRRGAHVAWASLPGRAFAGAARGQARAHESRGSISIEDSLLERCPDQRVDTVAAHGDGVRISGSLRCERGAVEYTLDFTPGPDGLDFALALADGPYNRTYLTGASTADERFFGFGEQFTWFDLKGARVPIVVQEQGIGRGAFPITLGANLTAGAGGTETSSYAAVPHYLTSRLRSFFLTTTEYATFDLRAEDRVTVELFAPVMTGRLLAGDSPLELIESYTAHAGRMRRLPDWILSGAVVGVQGGTARVRDVRERLASAGVPVAAYWLQDWVGQRTTSFGKQLWWNWELDQDHYPGWDALRADLQQDGARVLTYVNPFLADVAEVKPNARRNLFQEARAQGHLVRTASGEPYLIPNTSFSAGLVDLSSAAAQAWLKGILRDEVLARGASGWMADFGEALPFDSVLASGEAATFHNEYPEVWAQVNREAIEEAGVGDDAVFFSRSGYTRSPGRSTLFWLGDQLVSWDEYDGIKSAVVGLLSGGLSGYSLNHSDIGGYTTINNPLQRYYRSAELLKRWAELAAFTVVFRTHEGNLPDRNQQVYSSDENLAHFARMARVYRAWDFYRRELVDEAALTGHPVARHLFLHYPEDPEVLRLRYEEFLVGTELLVAPVLDPGREQVRVYLPAGGWIHLWSGDAMGDEAAGSWQVVDAPLGQPAVFFRRGSSVGQQLRERLAAEGLLERG